MPNLLLIWLLQWGNNGWSKFSETSDSISLRICGHCLIFRPTNYGSVGVHWCHGYVCILGAVQTWTFKFTRTAVCILLSKPAETILHTAPSSTKNSISHLPRPPYGLAQSWHHAHSSFHNIQHGKCLMGGTLHLLIHAESRMVVLIMLQWARRLEGDFTLYTTPPSHDRMVQRETWKRWYRLKCQTLAV